MRLLVNTAYGIGSLTTLVGKIAIARVFYLEVLHFHAIRIFVGCGTCWGLFKFENDRIVYQNILDKNLWVDMINS